MWYERKVLMLQRDISVQNVKKQFPYESFCIIKILIPVLKYSVESVERMLTLKIWTRLFLKVWLWCRLGQKVSSMNDTQLFIPLLLFFKRLFSSFRTFVKPFWSSSSSRSSLDPYSISLPFLHSGCDYTFLVHTVSSLPCPFNSTNIHPSRLSVKILSAQRKPKIKTMDIM